jgi:hypothetical protein
VSPKATRARREPRSQSVPVFKPPPVEGELDSTSWTGVHDVVRSQLPLLLASKKLLERVYLHVQDRELAKHPTE